MSAAPLPNRVNIRKAVTRSARYSGRLGADQLPQFAELFEAGKPALDVAVEFGEDEEGRQFALVEMEAEVVLECQRCLQPVQQHLAGKSRLGLVADDEQARHLPAGLEPLIAVDEVDLWMLAAEELALALPVVAYHPRGACEPPQSDRSERLGRSENEERGSTEHGSDNPFSVLSALLDSTDTKEK